MSQHPLHTIEIERRYRAFQVRYMAATNTRPSRVKIVDTRNDVQVTVPWTHDLNNASEYALRYLAERRIPVTAMVVAELDSGCLLLSEDFATRLAPGQP